MKVRAAFKKSKPYFYGYGACHGSMSDNGCACVARNYNLKDKDINYREYLSFVIAGNEYTMTQLTGEGADLSGLDKSTPVYAKVDVNGLNEALNTDDTYALDTKQTYMSRHIQSNVTVFISFPG